MKLAASMVRVSVARSYRIFDDCPGSLPCPTAAPGDFNGKPLDESTLDWGEWTIRTSLGGQTLPDTVDGVRYLPPNLVDGVVAEFFVADLTIQQGTRLVFSPYFVFGERYEDGSEDPV